MDTHTTIETLKFTQTQIPLHYRPYTQTTTTLRDASFSSYLPPPPPPPEPKTIADDSEISIFDAQKYFNETPTIEPKQPRFSNSTSHCTFTDEAHANDHFARMSSASDNHGKLRSFHVTPTASSEASWNSQVGLLSNPKGSISISLKNNHQENKRGSNVTKWIFGRKCPCAGRKSIQVQKVPNQVLHTKTQRKISMEILPERKSITQNPRKLSSSEIQFPSNIIRHDQVLGHSNFINHKPKPSIPTKTQRNSTSTEKLHEKVSMHTQQHRVYGPIRSYSDIAVGNFSFPILNSSSTPPSIDPPRDSLEVFQPSDSKLISINGPDHDDAASDASSDLFEIESFSTTKSNNPVNKRRDSLEETTSSFNSIRRLYNGRYSLDDQVVDCGYEPSEASIDWSVTTAEGFSGLSEIEFEGGENRRRKENYGLLSCRNEKAVSVGPSPVKCVAKEETCGTGYPIISTLMHGNSRVPPLYPNDKRLIGEGSRLSLAFAT